MRLLVALGLGWNAFVLSTDMLMAKGLPPELWSRFVECYREGPEVIAMWWFLLSQRICMMRVSDEHHADWNDANTTGTRCVVRAHAFLMAMVHSLHYRLHLASEYWSILAASCQAYCSIITPQQCPLFSSQWEVSPEPANG